MITIQAGYAIVVDDEHANRDFLERLLQTASFKVIGAGTGAAALAAAEKVPELALALVDHELPDATGLEIIRKLRASNPETLLVMATMHDSRDLIDEAFAAGIDVFLVKPHGFMELYRRLKEVDSDTTLLRALIIDQYGPRPYKGTTTGRRLTTAEQAAVKQETTNKLDVQPTVAATPENKTVVETKVTEVTPSSVSTSTEVATKSVETPTPAASTEVTPAVEWKPTVASTSTSTELSVSESDTKPVNPLKLAGKIEITEPKPTTTSQPPVSNTSGANISITR